jgi:acyl-CoA thioesterase FadM
MNLFFRLLIVFMRAAMAKVHIGILDEARLKYRVWLTDQDMFAHMTNSRYMSFADLGTVNYIIRSGCWRTMRKLGWFPVICGQSMTITRMLKTPQKFEIVSNLVGWDDTYVGISHKFMRDGRQHAEVRVIAKFASRDKKRLMPQDMIDAVGSDAVSPSMPRAYQDIIDQLRFAKEAQDRSKRNAT